MTGNADQIYNIEIMLSAWQNLGAVGQNQPRVAMGEWGDATTSDSWFGYNICKYNQNHFILDYSVRILSCQNMSLLVYRASWFGNFYSITEPWQAQHKKIPNTKNQTKHKIGRTHKKKRNTK